MKSPLRLLLFVLIIFSANTSAQDLKWVQTDFYDGSVREKYQVLKKKKRIRQGEYIRFYKSGVINIRGMYHENERIGLWECFHPNEQYAFKGYRKENLKDSIWQYFSLDGQLRVKGAFDQDQRAGVWQYLVGDSVDVHVSYWNGQKEGPWVMLLNNDTIGRGCFEDNLPLPDKFVYPNNRTEQSPDSTCFAPELPAEFYMLEFSGRSTMEGPESHEPMFTRGMDALERYLGCFVDLPRELFTQLNKSGFAKQRCYIQFNISAYGTTENIKVLRSFSKKLDKELIHVISNMPIWIPAVNENIPVRSVITIPFVFQGVRF